MTRYQGRIGDVVGIQLEGVPVAYLQLKRDLHIDTLLLIRQEAYRKMEHDIGATQGDLADEVYAILQARNYGVVHATPTVFVI